MSVEPSELHEKTLALLVMGTDKDGHDDWAIFFGIAKYEGQTLVLNRGEDRQPVVIRDDWVERIVQVPEGTENVFDGAEYYLPLTAEHLPPDVDPTGEGYRYTGLQWPSD